MAQYIGTKNLIEVYQKIAELQQAAMSYRAPPGGNSPATVGRAQNPNVLNPNATGGQNQNNQPQPQPQQTTTTTPTTTTPTSTGPTQNTNANTGNTSTQQTGRGQKRARKPSVTSENPENKKVKVKTEREPERPQPQRRESVQNTQPQQQPPPNQQQPTGLQQPMQNTGFMHTNNQMPLGGQNQPNQQQNQSEMYINDLLEQNLIIIANIRNNIAHRKINDNISLISKFRENIIQVLTCMSKMNGIMSQMPPIPVKLNTICIPQQQTSNQQQQARSTPQQQ
jgi:hypothetical protein